MAAPVVLDANGNVVQVLPEFNPPPGTLNFGGGTDQVPRTDGGAVGSGTSTGSVSNTTSRGIGASTNFSLQNFETLILSDIASVLSSPLVGWGIVLFIVYFAWKHFHKRH